jgi:glyoxylase-like metal-dependent hydrolase (beta-lactamase superfamily II)
LKSIGVGRVDVIALTDIEGAFFRLDQIFPGVMEDQWEPYLHRYPWAFAGRETLRGRVGSYVLRSPESTVLVDTGVGPQAMGAGGRLLVELENAGVYPEDVDTVFLTHLHGDHLGWSVKPDGEPVFPEALLAWLEADGITVAAGHIPGSGFGRIVRDGGDEGRRYWLTLEVAQEAEDLSGADLFRGGRS